MATRTRDWRFWLADSISLVTYPVLVVLAAIVVISYVFAPSLTRFWHWTTDAVLLVLGPSSLYTIYIWFKEKRVDFDLTKREDRVVPLMLATFGAVVGSYFAQTHIGVQTVEVISYVLVAMLVLLTIVTMMWKISLHAATMASTVSLLVFLVGYRYAWLYLLLLPIIWSRLLLKRHTIAQLLVGSLVGAGITLLAGLVFRG